MERSDFQKYPNHHLAQNSRYHLTVVDNLILKANLNLYILFFIALIVSGCSIKTNQEGVPALYDTKAEAEKAAESFDCTGAHKMGSKWMPCSKHADHNNHKGMGH